MFDFRASRTPESLRIPDILNHNITILRVYSVTNLNPRNSYFYGEFTVIFLIDF